MTTPTWLWTKTSETTGDYWMCHQCSQSGTITPGFPIDASAHVTETGHTIAIVHEHITIIEGVATSGRAADV